MKTFLGIIILSFVWAFIKPGEPVPEAEVFIVQEGNDTPQAFQKTGDNGQVTFSNLQRGLYRIKVVFPQQAGKQMRGKNNINCPLSVGYHNEKHEYFIREDEGFFTIQYSQLKKITNKNITPVYDLQLDRRKKVVEVGKIEVSGSNGSFTMQIRAQKPKTFDKMIQKVRNDVGMVTIKNAV